LKVTDIKPNPNNPRIIKDDKFKKLVKSIQDFPQMLELRPMIVDNDNVLLGGNMRLKAIQELGMKDIPDTWVKKASELTEEQKKEFIIKDNVGFGEWDWDMLANEWEAEQLNDWGLDVPEFEVEPEAKEDDYEIPDTIETDIVLGDLFEIGEHRLLCGDSTDSDAVARLMNGSRADLALSDPPYNLGFKYNSYKDDKSEKEYLDFCTEWFMNLKLFSINQIVTPGKQNIFMWEKIERPLDYATWYAKNKMSGGKISNLALTEPILFYGKINRNSRATDFFEYNVKQQKDTGGHTCPKIIGLFGDLIECYSMQSVLDLFLGSGTTMVASHQLKRKCYGMELDPKYCQVIIDRMLKLDENLVVKRNGEVWQTTKI